MPALLTPDPAASKRFIEFFTANIRNPNTRKAYARAAAEFATRCDRANLHELREMTKEDDNANLVLADIERSEHEMLTLYEGQLCGPVGYQHFCLFGIARRALAESAGFRQMVLARNSGRLMAQVNPGAVAQSSVGGNSPLVGAVAGILAAQLTASWEDS